MTRKDIQLLKSFLTQKELIPVEQIPAVFKNDFQEFFFGKTLVKDNNSLFAYPDDVKIWVRSIFNKYRD